MILPSGSHPRGHRHQGPLPGHQRSHHRGAGHRSAPAPPAPARSATARHGCSARFLRSGTARVPDALLGDFVTLAVTEIRLCGANSPRSHGGSRRCSASLCRLCRQSGPGRCARKCRFFSAPLTEGSPIPRTRILAGVGDLQGLRQPARDSQTAILEDHEPCAVNRDDALFNFEFRIGGTTLRRTLR